MCLSFACPPRRHRRDGVLVEPRNHGGYLYAARLRETSVDIQLTNAPGARMKSAPSPHRRGPGASRERDTGLFQARANATATALSRSPCAPVDAS